MRVRVYKDIEIKDDDDYIENAIEVATDCLSDFEVEILEKEECVQRQEQIIEEVSSMTVDEFQTECEDHKIEGVQGIDEMVNQLVQSKMELGE
jgi:hypothetical protein